MIMNQLNLGIKTEKEHKKTIKFIKHYIQQHKVFPPEHLIYKKIATDHLKENPSYYKLLAKAKL
jgi:sulfur relay (sulfurtransferase) DsrC/TusE family protein